MFEVVVTCSDFCISKTQNNLSQIQWVNGQAVQERNVRTGNSSIRG